MAWSLRHPFDEAFARERAQCGHLFRIGIAAEAAFKQQFSGAIRKRMAFVIGIFMHISTTILFESSDIHRFNLAKLGAIAAGTGLGFLSVVMH